MLLHTHAVLTALVLALWHEPAPSEGARILGIFPIPCKSHLGVFTTLTRELARRGHELVVFSPFPLASPPENYTDIDIMPTVRDYYEESMNLDLYGYNDVPIYFPMFYWSRGYTYLDLMFEDPGLRDLLYDKQGFDLVICEDLLTEALCAFADYFKAPKIMISSIGGYHMVNYAVGNPLELAYVPNTVLPYTDHMTFFQRFKNVLFTGFWDLGNQLLYLPHQEQLRYKIFGENTSTVWELRDQASLVLLNNHFSLNYPRPHLPSVIEVGGFHVKRKPDPLPADIQQFLDGATEGAIYFSMGSNLRSDAMSADKRAAVIAAFAELPQRVLMKWESDSLRSQPPNVKLGEWLPQQDILAHPNVRVFVTHGGLMSCQEAAFHGVPLVGIPVFGDQELNMLKAQNEGYGVMVAPLTNVTKQSMLWAIRKALTDPRIIREAKRRSEVYRDQPDTPLDRAVFWTEYVIRHGGAPHLRSAALRLNWYERSMLDVGALMAALMFLIVAVFVLAIRRICCSSSRTSPHRAKKLQ